MTSWENNLTNVFSPQNLGVNLGWGNLVLTTAYEWDGVSNLVIEICFNNLNSGAYTFNWSTPYQLAPLTLPSTIEVTIQMLVPIQVHQLDLKIKRPITKFKVCDVSNPITVTIGPPIVI